MKCIPHLKYKSTKGKDRMKIWRGQALTINWVRVTHFCKASKTSTSIARAECLIPLT